MPWQNVIWVIPRSSTQKVNASLHKRFSSFHHPDFIKQSPSAGAVGSAVLRLRSASILIKCEVAGYLFFPPYTKIPIKLRIMCLRKPLPSNSIKPSSLLQSSTGSRVLMANLALRFSARNEPEALWFTKVFYCSIVCQCNQS